MILRFTGVVFFWKGPAPWHFVSVPDAECGALEASSPVVSYGWGMIPATVTIGRSAWTTALWPKDGGYLVPIKAHVRKAEQIDIGDNVGVRLDVDV